MRGDNLTPARARALGRIGGLTAASRGIEARRAQTAKARATLRERYIEQARAQGTPEAEMDAQARRLHAIDLARYRLRATRNPSPTK